MPSVPWFGVRCSTGGPLVELELELELGEGFGVPVVVPVGGAVAAAAAAAAAAGKFVYESALCRGSLPGYPICHEYLSVAAVREPMPEECTTSWSTVVCLGMKGAA